jgi:hypothetical protein
MVRSQHPADLSEHILSLDAEMAELLLLLPTSQAEALEEAAHERGLTSAQLTRRLIAAFLRENAPIGRAPHR